MFVQAALRREKSLDHILFTGLRLRKDHAGACDRPRNGINLHVTSGPALDASWPHSPRFKENDVVFIDGCIAFLPWSKKIFTLPEITRSTCSLAMGLMRAA